MNRIYMVGSFLVYVLFFFFSCFPVSEENIRADNVAISAEYIAMLSKEEPGLPLTNGNKIIFFKKNNKYKCAVNLGAVHTTYENQFSKKYASFNEFLTSLLAQKITIDKYIEDPSKIEFQIVDSIMSRYDDLSLEEFISKYFNGVKDNQRFTLKKEKTLSTDELYTILYLCFINNFVIGFDDYIGKYSVIRV